ncbi:MAG: UvrD-helicase domain-containing protein, partial [Nostocoides sp.]
GGYAHVLIDEAQDLSPMQWRMVGRRGRTASWTVVGDAAQASWSDLAEANRARDEAFSGQERRAFHMDTNYRNAREIFDYARDVILPLVPDADIPIAVRETGFLPIEVHLATGPDPDHRRVSPEGSRAVIQQAHGPLPQATADAVERMRSEVEGSIAVVTPRRWADRLAVLDGAGDGRVRVIDPLSTKGLEWDATVVVDPETIVAESPGGIRALYVVLTRAAHRMTILHPA